MTIKPSPGLDAASPRAGYGGGRSRRLLAPWKRSLLLSAIKNRLPFRNLLRRQMRRLRPYRTSPRNDGYALQSAARMIEAVRAASGGRLAGTLVDVGSGWAPIAPIAFHAGGCDRVRLTDISPNMDARTLAHAKSVVAEGAALIADAAGVAPEEAARRARAFPHEYDPAVAWPHLQNESVDLIISRTVLEHIAAPALARLLHEWRRILRPGGLMCHIVDNSDHYEHFDKSIGRLNFLRYGPRTWRMIEAVSGDAQNRLRHDDYPPMFRDAGFEIVSAQGAPHAATLARLNPAELHSDYAEAAPERLAILESLFVLRRPF